MSIARKTVLTALAMAAIGLSATANAHDRHSDRHWKHGHPHKHWHGRHYERHVVRDYYGPAYVVRERIVVQRPVYVAPPPPAYSYYYHAPVRRPGVVVHVDVPPIVIPIR